MVELTREPDLSTICEWEKLRPFVLDKFRKRALANLRLKESDLIYQPDSLDKGLDFVKFLIIMALVISLFGLLLIPFLGNLIGSGNKESKAQENSAKIRELELKFYLEERKKFFNLLGFMDPFYSRVDGDDLYELKNKLARIEAVDRISSGTYSKAPRKTLSFKMQTTLEWAEYGYDFEVTFDMSEYFIAKILCEHLNSLSGVDKKINITDLDFKVISDGNTKFIAFQKKHLSMHVFYTGRVWLSSLVPPAEVESQRVEISELIIGFESSGAVAIYKNAISNIKKAGLKN